MLLRGGGGSSFAAQAVNNFVFSQSVKNAA
jgi:hypothetical protein